MSPCRSNGLSRFEPLDDVIVFAQAFSAAKIGLAVRRQAAHAIDAALFKHHHFGPGAHQAISEHDIAGEKQMPQGAQHPQLALSLAGVATDADIKNCPAGEREDCRESCERKA